VLVLSSLPEVLTRASASGGYKTDRGYGELEIDYGNKMVHRGSREASGIDGNLLRPSRCSGDEIKLSSSGEGRDLRHCALGG
jgi:hypothetical protein